MAGNNDGALHRVNNIKSHFLVVTTVKNDNDVKYGRTSKDPSRVAQLDVLNFLID